LSDDIDFTGMTMLEQGRIFSAYRVEQQCTWAEAAAYYGLNDNTVRGYGCRYDRQQEDRTRQQQRQLDKVEQGGKAAKFSRPRVLLRAAVFDVETSDFGSEGYEGFLLCCCILPLDSDEVQTIRLDFGDNDDQRVLIETVQSLSAYDLLIGHFIDGFDLPWLASRLAYHNLPPYRRWFSIDTYKLARRAKLRTRKKLSTLIDYFQVPGIKTAVERTSWSHARSPFPGEFEAAMDDIIYHCENDVLANRQVFEALYPLIMNSRYSSSSPIGIFDQGSGCGLYSDRYGPAGADSARPALSIAQGLAA
jgi:hypothetical protein